jgi:type II secretory pathway predicted ATPase ExeA
MTHDKKLLALFGLKWNPFVSNIPVESLWIPPAFDSFFFRVENLVMEGGFAMISAEPGLGKSKILQLISHRLSPLQGVSVGVMERPQSSLADFYRELGAIFGVNLSPANRYGGFKALRDRWLHHIKTTLFRPVLLIDEAQEMVASCLNEVRLLSSTHFDSQCILTSILCGDMRLPERLRTDELVSLGTRIRSRLILEPLHRDHLMAYLDHALDEAAAPHLMTDPLKEALSEHCLGNLRVLNLMAAELLEIAAQRELAQLDEKLFLEIYSRQPRTVKTRS